MTNQENKANKRTQPDFDPAAEDAPENEETFTPSAGLMAKMEKLKTTQQVAIWRLVVGERQGHKLTRLLYRAARSCRWCGARANSLEKWRAHEARCKRRWGGAGWQFVITDPTYYNWKKDPLFVECLAQARCEVTNFVMRDTLLRLRFSAEAAADELCRQVKHSQNEGNRQRAAIAILDRVGLETMAKTIDQPNQAQIWFDNLVRVGEEEEDEAWAPDQVRNQSRPS